ncbi:MAG: response regulator [Methylobacter sp.]|uniref:response regulator n=1 Tax=Methylobacter TaxID=429 RepID=UPI00036C3016|nr:MULTISPECIES: response regulator [Methylobacter]MCL7419977.1 response regulator [Methylobacter sp.]
MNSIQPILLVEDDQVDIMTVERGLKKLGVINKLVTVNNGEEALQYLESSEDELPCMILLDINMPKMNGHECLKQLKSHPAFKNIPVIMLTSSMEQQDVDQGFALGISGYILKPVDYDQFIDAIQVLNSYWTIKK